MISHAELVESIFGYWPEFSDGRIELLSFEQPGIICLRIFYIDYQIDKAATVTLQFTGVTDVDLSELRKENVVDVLSISEASPFLVTIKACYGLGGTFVCTSAEVAAVVPKPSVEADSYAAAQLKLYPGEI